MNRFFPLGFSFDEESQFDRYDWTEWGKRDRRTKEEFPYSYSDHFILRTVPHDKLKAKGIDAVYDDRMRGWDHAAWEKACASVPEKRFDQFTQNDLNKFLSAYFGKPVKGLAISEGCNASSDYPYFVFYYKKAEKCD